jgi:hypothetical protein
VTDHDTKAPRAPRKAPEHPGLGWAKQLAETGMSQAKAARLMGVANMTMSRASASASASRAALSLSRSLKSQGLDIREAWHEVAEYELATLLFDERAAWRAMRRVAVVGLLAGLTLTGCGSSRSAAPTPQVEPCFIGGPVGPIEPPNLNTQPEAPGGIPDCALNRVVVWTTQCFPHPGGPQHGSVFLVGVHSNFELVGRTGGTWVQVQDPNVDIYDLGVGIGCSL